MVRQLNETIAQIDEEQAGHAYCEIWVAVEKM